MSSFANEEKGGGNKPPSNLGTKSKKPVPNFSFEKFILPLCNVNPPFKQGRDLPRKRNLQPRNLNGMKTTMKKMTMKIRPMMKMLVTMTMTTTMMMMIAMTKMYASTFHIQ